jgi:hypothetical protein
MIKITDELIAELKLFIKEHYKLVSFDSLFPGKKSKLSQKAKGIRGKSFGEVTDEMTSFIKEKRDYESFAFVLEKLREEKGLSTTELYRAAWVDKRLYSKIATTPNYRPSKNTAITFGLALRLKSKKFEDYLRSAGFALSDNSIFDLVIRFCVEREIYDLHDVNALLLQADQKSLMKEVVDV